MLLMGDEVRSTQLGNNNAYCQDNEISWFDWSLVERHADMLRFVSLLNAFRRRRDVIWDSDGVSLNAMLERTNLKWHGVALDRPDWGDRSHSLAFTMRSARRRFLFHAMMNAYWEPLTFALPETLGGESWRRCIDTALPSPADISSWADAPAITDRRYRVESRSVVLLAMSLGGADATSDSPSSGT